MLDSELRYSLLITENTKGDASSENRVKILESNKLRPAYRFATLRRLANVEPIGKCFFLRTACQQTTALWLSITIIRQSRYPLIFLPPCSHMPAELAQRVSDAACSCSLIRTIWKTAPTSRFSQRSRWRFKTTRTWRCNLGLRNLWRWRNHNSRNVKEPLTPHKDAESFTVLIACFIPGTLVTRYIVFKKINPLYHTWAAGWTVRGSNPSADKRV